MNDPAHQPPPESPDELFARSGPQQDADILAIMKKFDAMEPPPGGLEQVLAAVRAARSEGGTPAVAVSAPAVRRPPEAVESADPRAGRVLTMPRRHWLSGAAACVAAGAGGFLWLRSLPGRLEGSGTRSVESFADAVCLKATGRILLARSSASVTDAGSWLRERAAPLCGALPALATMKAVGCQRYSWEGEEVSLICLAAGGGITHLFSVARSAVPDVLSAPATPPPSRILHGLQTTLFADALCLNVLVGSKPHVNVREIAGLIV